MYRPLGVDLIEIKKAKEFYETHGGRLADLLTENELRFLKKSKKRYDHFAMLLSGKEAVYKALGGPKSRVASFEKIPLSVDSKRQLFFKPKSRKKIKLEFIKTKNFIIASCL